MRRLVALLSLLGLLGCSNAGAPRAAGGVVDLRGWRFDEVRVLSLQGEWEIHWGRLVAPGEPSTPDGAVPIGRWNGQRLYDGQALGGKGVATYRLLVRLPETAASYTLHAPPLVDATRLIVSRPDGQRLAGPLDSGTVGTTRQASKGATRNLEASFTAGGDVLVTLQVSNFEHARGGSGPAPLFGSTEAIRARERHRRMADFFILGLLVVVGLQQLAQFVISRVDRSALWFGLMCLLIAGRLVILGRYPADEAPAFSTAASLRLEYLTGYLAVPLVALFIAARFPRYFDRRFLGAMIWCSLAFAASVVLPRPIFTTFQTPFQVVIVFGLGYAIVALLRALHGERDLPPALMLAGFVVLSASVAWDIARVHMVIQPLQTATQYGLSGFVLFQSTMLAVLNRRRARELEQRNRDVQLLNEELRQQIAHRSHELSHALALLASGDSAKEVLAPGTTLAEKYRIEQLIGEGGMGKVYRATRLADGRPVAVKLVRGGDPAILARFAREAELVARIAHPHVVGILDFGITSDAVLFLVMELVDGQSLEHLRNRFGDPAWAVPMVAQLASALEAIHALGVVHRDVKPANVLVAGSLLKLTDFGVAHVKAAVEPGRSAVTTLAEAPADTTGARTAPIDPLLTRAGMLIGSPLYMAPELGLGADHASPRSDVFSFGLVAYELLSGRRAYDRPLVTARIQGSPLPDAPPPLTSLVPALPADLAAVVDDCLKVAPDARPTAATVARLFAGARIVGAR